MDCPKCGAVNPDGSQECAACGIIFARWQPRPARTFSGPQQPIPEIPPEKSTTIPVWMVFAALGIVVVFGLVWTARQRAARAKLNPDDIINNINVKGMKQRQSLAQEAAKARAQALAAQLAAAPKAELPDDVNESAVIAILEQCSFFQQPAAVIVPKEFRSNSSRDVSTLYPGLAAAAREKLVEISPPIESSAPNEIIHVWLTDFANTRVEVTEVGDGMYHFGIGRRRITSVTPVAPSSDVVLNVMFDWKYERPVGLAIAPDGVAHKGGATLQRSGGGWTLNNAWAETPTHERKTICS